MSSRGYFPGSVAASTFLGSVGYFNNQVRNIAVQSDGKVLIVGDFSSYVGPATVSVNRIVRLNTDGSVDTTFNTNIGTGPNFSVTRIKIQSDGKIIVIGGFGNWNGTTVTRMVRLNANGTLDTAFTTALGTGPVGAIEAIEIQSDGKIIVTGAFGTWNGVTVNRIVRLNTDGTRDTAFTTNTGTGANSTILSAVIQADQKIVLGGAFTTWNGTTSIGRIVRLNTDGTRDTAFTTNISSGATTNQINSIAIQSDNKLVVVGTFTTWISTSVNRIVRLNTDGTRDTAFTTALGAGITSTSGPQVVLVQPDQKILLGGIFTSISGTTCNNIARINTNGSLDTAFSTSVGAGPSASSAVQSLALQSNNSIIAGGTWTSWNSVAKAYMVLLNSTGSLVP
jgi:uncharacterized delta-60 repeat protein